MGHSIFYEIVFLASVFISSVSQVVLKKSAEMGHGSRAGEYLNPYVLGAYGMFLASSAMTALAYRSVPFSRGQVLESAGYIYITVLSAVFLGERVCGREAIGIACIVAGVAVYAL